MKTRSIVRFAWKNLLAHRSRFLLTLGGVMLSVVATVFLVSMGYGLEHLVTNQVANFEAFTVIDVPAANLKTGKIDQDAIQRTQNIPHILSVNEVVDLAGRVRLRTEDATTETVVIGSTPDYFKLEEITLESGEFFTVEQTDRVVIDRALAGLLGFSEKPEEAIGKELYLDIIIAEDLRSRDTVEGPLVKSQIPVTVVGLTNNNPNPILFMPLALADQHGVVNRTSLKIKVEDRQFVEQVRTTIEAAGYSTEYVGDTVAQIAQMFSIFRVILGGLGLIALTIAALGTFNTLTISLMERIREVGLLKTLGMQRATIFKLFIAESLTIGFLGGVFGLGLGLLAGAGVNALLRFLAHRVEADPVTIYYTPALFAVVVLLGALAIGFITGFYPARRAIKTSALDVLRYE